MLARLRTGLLWVFVALAATGCYSFEIPADMRRVRVAEIEQLSLVGFDRNPDVEDGDARADLVERFNDELEDHEAETGGEGVYEIHFTNLCVLFRGQRFTFNQLNPFSRDAYLFAEDVEFGVLYRFRVTRDGEEIIPETPFFSVEDRLFYFERSSPFWWLVTFTLFPYYDYYYYSGASVSEAMVSRVLNKLLNEQLPRLLGAAPPAPPP